MGGQHGFRWEVKAAIIAKYAKKDGDTGSAEVQIALSEQLNFNRSLKSVQKDKLKIRVF